MLARLHELRFRSHLSKGPAAVFALYERANALRDLTPPELGRILWAPPRPLVDTAAVIAVNAGPWRTNWVSRIVSYNAPHEFTDQMVCGPFNRWEHRHGVEAGPDADTAWLDDHLFFQLPGGVIGDRLGAGLARRRIERLFRWRHRRHAELIGAEILGGFALQAEGRAA